MGKVIAVGIDPSFTGTGIVILVDDEFYYSNTILTDSNETVLDRVANICFGTLKALDKALYRYAGKQDDLIIAIEGFSFASKGSAVFQIGYLGWKLREIINEFCKEREFNWIEVPPNNLKLFATGKGNSAKELIMLQVYKRWGQEFTDNNQADAFVLAKMANAHLMGNKGLTDFQVKSMKALKGVNK